MVFAAERAGTPGSLYLPQPCTITAVSDLTPQEKLFRIELPENAALGHQPGQFVQVSLFGHTEAPISVASSPTRSGFFELGVRRAGRLTTALHALRPGDRLGIRGPFGRPFDLPRLRGHDLLLIAGGCGLAPMRSLVQYVEDRPTEFGRVTLLYGAKSPEAILFKAELGRWQARGGFACLMTVDEAGGEGCWDGSVGQVTRLLAPLNIDAARTIAAVVGPPAMYRFVIAELNRKGIPDARIAVSLERQMRCGVGKCGHCAIDHLYCCCDGPVFWLDAVRDVPGAL